MNIQVKHQLTKSRNPTEHNIRLENQVGEIVHVLGDGFSLIRFKQFKVKEKMNVKRKTVWIFKDLEWYIHDTDFFIKQI